MNAPRRDSLAVTSQTLENQDAAQILAQRLGLNFLPINVLAQKNNNADFFLELTPERLQLRESSGKTNPLYVDFVTLAQQRKGGEAIRKALGKNVTTVLDATAGLGRDAFVIAAQGFQVTLLERVPAVAALLEDGLRRGADVLPEIIARINLVQSDARDYLTNLSAKPDVIYLDPMFPERRKSAQVKKAMRFFQALVGDDDDAADVLDVARRQAAKRVVVKRPRRASILGENQPHTTIVGKTTRFDVYLPLA